MPLIFAVTQKNTSLKKLFENLSSPQKATESDNNTYSHNAGTLNLVPYLRHFNNNLN
jgi:hypothetical protein